METTRAKKRFFSIYCHIPFQLSLLTGSLIDGWIDRYRLVRRDNRGVIVQEKFLIKHTLIISHHGSVNLKQTYLIGTDDDEHNNRKKEILES